MSHKLDTHKTGLALGGTIGIVHLLWSLVVAGGFAQPLIDFIMRVHMIAPSETVLPFDLTSAIGLVVITSVVGYVVGYLFASVWNSIQK